MTEPPRLDYQTPQRRAPRRSPKVFFVALVLGVLSPASLWFAAAIGGGEHEYLAALFLDIAAGLAILTLLVGALAMLLFLGGE
jgi:hypothetical protein